MIELSELSLEQAKDLLMAYDRYIKDYIEEHGVCEDGCAPVCLDEFFDNDYPLLEKPKRICPNCHSEIEELWFYQLYEHKSVVQHFEGETLTDDVSEYPLDALDGKGQEYDIECPECAHSLKEYFRSLCYKEGQTRIGQDEVEHRAHKWLVEGH